MKKFFYIIPICFFFLITSSGVFAQTASTSAYSGQATSSAKTNLNISKSLTSLMTLLKAALTRADKISQRMATRLVRLNSSNPQQLALTQDIEKLKKDFANLNLQSQALNTSVSSKQDYLLFKSQLTGFIKNLKDVYKKESDLLAIIKNLVSITVTSTATSSSTVSGQ